MLAIMWNTKELTESTMSIVFLSIFLFFIGYISAKYIRLPLSVQAGMCAVPYLMVGGLIKKYAIVDRFSKIQSWILGLIVLTWFYVIISTTDGLNMASCRYDDGIVRIPISIFVSICCLWLCKRYDSYMSGSLKWLGKNTLYVLAGHQIYQFVTKTINLEMNFLYDYVHFSPFKLFIEYPIQIAIAIIIGMTIKKLRLF